MPFNVDLEFASKTDTGRVRTHNEDAIAISEQCGFAILADGMGGYNAGEVASQIATSVLKEALEERLLNIMNSRFGRGRRLHQLITESIVHTNASILEAARLEPSYNGMGTTLVVTLFYDDKVIIGHIGDSRVYRLRDKEITQLTRDHSLLQEQIDAGLLTEEEAQFSHNKNLITRALGVEHDLLIELNDYLTRDGDLYLVCSDGLSDMLADGAIAELLKYSDHDLKVACELMISSANLQGGQDNISVILIKVRQQVPRARNLLQRMFALTN